MFPGAEGFGTHTRAGRSGKVFAVTSLADSGPGTLRDALADPSPKTIVFRAGGIIELRSLLFVAHPFVTIAGQTAPGDGIVLKNFGLVVTTNDVLIQSIRVRPGNTGAMPADRNKAIAILGPTGAARSGAYNVVLDHVSASWGEDETIATWFGPHDITVSWSIVSEGLNRSRHFKGGHSAGLIVGDHSDRVSLHHNLLAHNDYRNPLIISGGTHEIVNNVVYDWGSLVTEIVDDAAAAVNVVGTGTRQARPARRRTKSSSIRPVRIVCPESSCQEMPSRVRRARRPTSGRASSWVGDRGRAGQYRAAGPVPDARVVAVDAKEALKLVMADAGAVAPRRDSIDERIVADVRNGTGSIIDSPEQVGGYPVYNRGVAPADTDGDGIADEWERRNGLDPANPSDGNAVDRDGYTNLERYLHSLMPRPIRRSGTD